MWQTFPGFLKLELVGLYLTYPGLLLVGKAGMEHRWLVWCLIGMYVVSLLWLLKPDSEALGFSNVSPLLALAALGLLVAALITLALLLILWDTSRPIIPYAGMFLIYPFLSVPVQEFFFRSFFFFRYEQLMGRWGLLALNAFLFALNHLVYGAWSAVLASLLAGLLLSWLYVRLRSTVHCCLVHYLLGLGVYLAGFGNEFTTIDLYARF